jgi:hypothetical protein
MRCRHGKANPQKKADSILLAELLGVRALCAHNPFRESLIIRMYSPHRRFLWVDPPVPTLPAEVEIELIEEEESC